MLLLLGVESFVVAHLFMRMNQHGYPCPIIGGCLALIPTNLFNSIRLAWSRSLALGHLRPSDYFRVALKEGAAGAFMGSVLGALILTFSRIWESISDEVAVTVAISLPLVSLWANILGGVLPLVSARFGFNPAVTSAPLMTTVVDSSGLIIYFFIARLVMHLS